MLLASVLLSLAAAAEPKVLDRAVTHDRVIVAGQPTEADLDVLQARGVAHVVNLRTDAEMQALGLDERAKLEALGIDYTVIPIGGADHPYRPEALEVFAKLMQAEDGKVLLHCASGGRAGQLYAAYAVKYLGKSPDEALRSVEGAWPLPLEQLTGLPLVLERKRD